MTTPVPDGSFCRDGVVPHTFSKLRCHTSYSGTFAKLTTLYRTEILRCFPRMRIVILTGVFYFVFPCIAYIAGDTSRVVLTQDDFLHKHAAVYATYDDFINRRPLKGSWERRHHPNINTHEQHRYEECILTSPIARDESQYRVVMELRKFNNSIYDFWPRSFRLRPWSDAVQRLQDRTILFLGDSLQKFQASSFACQLAASSPTESLPLIWPITFLMKVQRWRLSDNPLSVHVSKRWVLWFAGGRRAKRAVVSSALHIVCLALR